MTAFDLVIVGAGPAGAAATLHAQRLGLRCVLLDKATFPRDKACGGALSGRSMALLRELGLDAAVEQLRGAAVRRVVFTAPDGTALEVGLDCLGPPEARARGVGAAGGSARTRGVVVRRRELDGLLFERAAAAAAECHQGFAVHGIERVAGMSLVHGRGAGGGSGQFRGRAVLGCDGFSSVVARSFGLAHRGPRHRMVAIRQYMRGVGGLTDQIELHFTRALAPGYFWIFPAGEQLANVGVGIDVRQLRGQRRSLPALLDQALSDPRLRPRFCGAEPVGRAAGWNLPVGSTRRPCHGEGVMLLGDAAGLVDPFTGEGIGNALLSARLAARAAAAALAGGEATAVALRPYAAQLWSALGPELATSTRLHHLSRVRPLLNWVIGRAGRTADGPELIGAMMTDPRARARLLRPSFYLRLLAG